MEPENEGVLPHDADWDFDGYYGIFAHGDAEETNVGSWDAPPLLSLFFSTFSPLAGKTPPQRTRDWRLKEPFSGLSHLLGALLSIVALLVLLFVSRDRPLHLASFAIYGATLIALFVASSLYHSLRVSPAAIARLQRLDYMAIFLLIAGTYTPICLLVLRGAWGWSLLAVEWTIALGGIVAVASLQRRFPEWLRVTLCGGLTWLIVVAVVPLWSLLPSAGLAWLLGGLIAYTVGTLILATDWPHLWPGRFSAHDLWHIFVLGGSACHFILMLLFVTPL